MPVPPRRSRAAGAYSPAIRPRSPRTFECEQCGARPYERCTRRVGDQYMVLKTEHDPRKRAARDGGHRGRGPLPGPGSPRGGTLEPVPPQDAD